MTNENLKNYISYLKGKEEKTLQKLDVLKRRQEQKIKRVQKKRSIYRKGCKRNKRKRREIK